MSEKEPKTSLLERFRKGLAKTREKITNRLEELFRSAKPIQELKPGLEELLITADIGVKTSARLIDELEKKAKGQAEPEKIKEQLKELIYQTLKPVEKKLEVPETAPKPYVIMVLGVNGAGKTTTIGKLAMRFKNQGLSVMLSASDTFRAGAIDQLEQWAKRAGAEIVRAQPGADPASVSYSAIQSALAKNIDVVIIDTAGRLHTKTNLMEELKKVKRVSEKALGKPIDQSILVLDATTGQNAIEQAKVFQKELGLSGIILTKLDGTAKGGIIIAIADLFQIPILMVGIGEGIEDLTDFQAQEFAQALFNST